MPPLCFNRAGGVTMTRDLGFGIRPASLEVSDYLSDSDQQNLIEQSIADRTAEKAGFESRESVARVARVRKPAQPLDQAFVRAPVAVINRYKRFCNESGLSYGEALEELLRRSGN
jgi:hypothetical protein